MVGALFSVLASLQDGANGETVVRSPRSLALATDTRADHVVVTAEETRSAEWCRSGPSGVLRTAATRRWRA